MKRHLLYVAMATACGWAGAAQAATASTDDVAALRALVAQQQKQLDQQQQALHDLQDQLSRMETRQPAPAMAPAAPRVPEVAQAATARDGGANKPVFTTAPGLSVALHGFVSATAFSQDRSFQFGNGTNAEYPDVTSAKGRLSGFDARNTRFWLDFTGARMTDNWTGGGRLELDFYGGFNGTGPYSASQALPRLRQAYMDLENVDTGTRFRIGQQWDLMYALDNTPVSLSHITFPLGFGTGIIGWRFPGVVWMQDLNHGSSGPQWRFDLGAFSGGWNGPGNNVNYLSAGNAGFQPQVEARLRVSDKTWIAYAVGHYSRVDLRGVTKDTATPVDDSVRSIGYEVGGIWKPGPWLLQGLVYNGRGLGELFGAFAQFGDIKESGGYLQAGYNFTPHWSMYATYATAKPNADDVIRWMGHGASGMLKNRQSALSVQYAAGAYALGVEWMHAVMESTPDGQVRKDTSGNQLSVSAMFRF